MRTLFLLCVTLFSPLFSEEDPPLTTTSHLLNVNGKRLPYLATVGKLPLVDEEETLAEIFFVAYTAEGKEGQERPLTFCFPGGPGGAGSLEAIVTFGPKRLLTASEGRTILPPYRLIDNPESLLPFTDLVFVDPVSCGYSRASNEEHLSLFYSIEGDIEVLAEFVRSYIALFDRWNAPKYLSGGSYGTLRCCGLAHRLLAHDIVLHGLVLNGCAIDWSVLQSERDVSLPDCLILPTYAATAWYHGRLFPEKTLDEVIDYARTFAFETYAPRMMRPSRISSSDQEIFYQRLAELIGLPLETVRRYKGRINEHVYTTQFFAREGKVLGALDTRYSLDAITLSPFERHHDPSYLDSMGIVPAFLSYLEKDLSYRDPFDPYTSFSLDAFDEWRTYTWDSFGRPTFLQRLRKSLLFNPFLKIFVASGYYDCRTPFAATDYCFDQLDLSPAYQKNIEFHYYEAGHGFVFDHASLKQFQKDLTNFYGKGG